MRLGLLRCDDFSHSLVSVHGGYLDLFSELFSRVDPSVELAEYNVVAGELPGDPAEQGAWLVSGSTASTYDDDPWIASFLDLLRNLDAVRAPTVGICFGHQALAQALGGNVRRSGRLGSRTATSCVDRSGWVDISFLSTVRHCLLPSG